MIDIFIKSYSRDFKLLSYSLQSIAKNVIGYNKIILCLPQKEVRLFNKTVNIPKDLNIEIHPVGEYGNGYLYQQICKLNAYKYSNAEFILFSDSDNIYSNPINLKDIIINNKPEILYRHYDDADIAIIWKAPTSKIMEENIDYEFMLRLPLLYHRSTIENIAKWKPNLESIIMNHKCGNDRGAIFSSCSEFNIMGAYAFKHEQDKYIFTNTKTWTYVPPIAEQLWSWANSKDTSEYHKTQYQHSLDTINKELNLNLTIL